MQIKTKLPRNVKKEHLFLFKQKESYTIRPLKMKLIRNVFVSHWGLIIKKLLLPKQSAENLIGTYDHSFYFKHWRIAIEQYLVSKFGKSLKSIKLEDEKHYFSIHTPWFGYFSWLTTCLPRLIAVSKNYPDAVLLLPEEWKSTPFVNDSLLMFENVEKREIANDHHVFVKHFVFCETRPWTSVFYPEQIEQVRDLFSENLLTAKIDVKPIQRLYVSRKKANRRKVVNEEEIENYLIENGFQSICFEDYNIYEQVFLMQNAAVVISMHGAGMANSMFMQPKSVLFELSPEIHVPKLFRFPFWRIASIIELEYYIQFCETIDNGEGDYYARNIKVDLEEFKRNVELFIE